MNKRYIQLDSLRGIAAIMIVLYHYTVRYNEIYGVNFDNFINFSAGRYGVQLFFIISGFVIFFSLKKTEHVFDFLISRFSRLYPIYWLSVIITFFVIYVFSLPGRNVDIVSGIINLTMFQKWLSVSDVDGVYWTLNLEMSFYAIMFMIFITKQMDKINMIMCLWLIVIIGSRYLEQHSLIEIPWCIKTILLLDYGNLFIAGICFYRIIDKLELVNCFLLCCCLFAEYYLHGKSVVVVGFFSVVLYLALLNKVRFLNSAILIYLGSISYGLYLIHQNIGYVIINAMKYMGYLNAVTLVIVPLSFSLALATLMHFFVEKKSIYYIRNKWLHSRFREYLLNKNRNA